MCGNRQGDDTHRFGCDPYDGRRGASKADPETAFSQLAASAGLAGTELPSEMAFINEVLDVLPDELCNVFLANYFNDLCV